MKVTDNKVITIIASNSLTKRFPIEKMIPFLIRLNFSKELLQLCVGVRIAMSDINCIIGIWKLNREIERMIKISIFSFEIILVIANIISVSKPADSLLLR